MMNARRFVSTGTLLGILCAAAWACSSFSASDAPTTSDAGGGSDASDASDATVVSDGDPAVDASAPSACLSGGGAILFQSFFGPDGNPSLNGWQGPFGIGTFTALDSGDAGSVGRGTIPADAGEFPYSTVTASPESLPRLPDFAVRFRFAVSSLNGSYVVHQLFGTENLQLRFDQQQWLLGYGGPPSPLKAQLGPAGTTGQWHTVQIAVHQASGKLNGSATFDTNPAVPFALEINPIQTLQLGPYYAFAGLNPDELSVEYDDVTIWDCSVR